MADGDDREAAAWDRIEAKLDRMAERTEQRFDEMAERTEARFDRVEGRLDNVENTLLVHGARLDRIEARLDQHGEILTHHGEILAQHSEILNRHADALLRLNDAMTAESRLLTSLAAAMDAGRRETDAKLDRMREELLGHYGEAVRRDLVAAQTMNQDKLDDLERRVMLLESSR